MITIHDSNSQLFISMHSFFLSSCKIVVLKSFMRYFLIFSWHSYKPACFEPECATVYNVLCVFLQVKILILQLYKPSYQDYNLICMTLYITIRCMPSSPKFFYRLYKYKHNYPDYDYICMTLCITNNFHCQLYNIIKCISSKKKNYMNQMNRKIEGSLKKTHKTRRDKQGFVIYITIPAIPSCFVSLSSDLLFPFLKVFQFFYSSRHIQYILTPELVQQQIACILLARPTLTVTSVLHSSLTL